MDEFSNYCDSWNDLKTTDCNTNYSEPATKWKKDCYTNHENHTDEVHHQIQCEGKTDNFDENAVAQKQQQRQDNSENVGKPSKSTKRTRTSAEEKKLVMSVYKNLLAGRCVDTFGSGIVKRTSELTGLPLRSVYRIRNEELIAHGSIKVEFDPAETQLDEDDTKLTNATKAIDKPAKRGGKGSRQKRLSLIKKKIIFHVFDTLRSEQPRSSDSAVINQTSGITGCPVRTIHRIRVEEKSERGLQGPKVIKAKDIKKPKYELSFKKYGDDIRLAIRTTIYELQTRTTFPIIKEIHENVNDRLNMSLSRSTLMRLIKHLGFVFVRKEGKKHILVEKPIEAPKKTKKTKDKSASDPTKKITDKKSKPSNTHNTPDFDSNIFDNPPAPHYLNKPPDYMYFDNKQFGNIAMPVLHPQGQVAQQSNNNELQQMSTPIPIVSSSSKPAESVAKPEQLGHKPKRILAKLNGDEVQSAIRMVVYDLKFKNVAPTINEIQQNVKTKFNIALARTTLHRHIKRAGFMFKKKEGNKHVLVEKPQKKPKRPRKPREKKDDVNAPPIKKPVRKSPTSSKKKTVAPKSTQTNSITNNTIPPDFDATNIHYDTPHPHYHAKHQDSYDLFDKQYNPVPLVDQQTGQGHLSHQPMASLNLLGHAQMLRQQQLQLQQPQNDLLRQMPQPIQPTTVHHRDMEISPTRKLMTLTAAKNCVPWS